MSAANPPPADGSVRESRHTTSLRRSLFLRFATLAAFALTLLTLGYVLFGLQPVAERDARNQFNTAVEQVENRLDQLFHPVSGLLGIAREWAAYPGFDIDRTEDFNRLFRPVLRQFPQITSVVAGNTAGHGWMLLELPGNRWRNRFTDVPRHGKTQRFIDWDSEGRPTAREEIVDYDARQRPWFTRAMSGPADGAVHWTPPYVFFTTRDPGITASSRVDLPGGGSFVIGFDIRLLDISRITAALALGHRGGVMVLTDDGRLLGAPRGERGVSDDTIREAVLKPAQMLGMAPVNDALARWHDAGRTAQSELRFRSGGEDWIVSFHPFVLGSQTFWTVAFAPVADFIPPWGPLLATLFAILLMVLLLSMAMAQRFARRFSAPVEALVASSERIANLDFSSRPAVETSMAELQRLAAAQERMRGMLDAFRDKVEAQATDLKRQIHTLRVTEARLEHLSQHDPLTDLPNRVLFNDRLSHAIIRAHRSKRLFAVLFVDLDNFKLLNDSRGHEAGDLMLVEVAQRLQLSVREEDSVARLGGDEFVVLVEDMSPVLSEASKQAEMIAEKVRAALAAPYDIDGQRHHASASIGVTLYRGENETGEMLLRSADGAMYGAKHSGRNTVQFFDPAMQASLDATAQIESDLREAQSGGQLMVYLQGQYDQARQLTGAETLLRWNHPTRGMVSPADFIPIAENSGLILPIGLWVIETACRQLRIWADSPRTRELSISVNVSPRQFRHAAFVDEVRRLLQETGTDGSRLTLELTESVVLDDIAGSVGKMHALKALGITLSMDDFGTGYSSLSYLSRLPLDEVKIDQAFIRKLDGTSRDAAIVHAIIGMAHSLGLNVTAEGVESREQFEWLVREGCDGFQGYLFNRAMPIERFEALALEQEPVS